MKRFGFFGLAAVLALGACGGPVRVIVAAGTTLVDSGIIDELTAQYEAEHPGIELSVVGESTARILDLGRRGAADLLITHAPALEAEFVAEGLAARHESVLVSRFVLAGPPVLGLEAPMSAGEALAGIARRGDFFVSRSDGSGTHEKELDLWDAAGIDPTGAEWYVETGQGMGLTLQVADQRGAFVLCEIGVFLAAAPSLSLEVFPLFEDPVLVNPYQLTVVSGSEVESAADGFATWLLSDGGRQAIIAANNTLFGQVVYQPVGS
jgi:tungstate transport system substrate-binding protein